MARLLCVTIQAHPNNTIRLKKMLQYVDSKDFKIYKINNYGVTSINNCVEQIKALDKGSHILRDKIVAYLVLLQFVSLKDPL